MFKIPFSGNGHSSRTKCYFRKNFADSLFIFRETHIGQQCFLWRFIHHRPNCAELSSITSWYPYAHAASITEFLLRTNCCWLGNFICIFSNQHSWTPHLASAQHLQRHWWWSQKWHVAARDLATFALQGQEQARLHRQHFVSCTGPRPFLGRFLSQARCMGWWQAGKSDVRFITWNDLPKGWSFTTKMYSTLPYLTSSVTCHTSRHGPLASE